ncbi:hypothetical protein F5884DRAFT_856596 [Xylogone sp. PMI_703]|nr:hypothetical protein F5884DRAFT_856596 [Xylogone sp. PMI_703]
MAPDRIIEGLPEDDWIRNFGGSVFGEYKAKMPEISLTVLALCGIPVHIESGKLQDEGLASPRKDGYLLSDFYLYHHLIIPVASDQVWMTCVDPLYAACKYGEYVHRNGSPDEARVVLESSMLQELGDVIVSSPDDSFVSKLSEAVSLSRAENRPLLILIFAHGDPVTYSYLIGGDGELNTAPKLTENTFEKQLVLNSILVSAYSQQHAIM